jgi:hypothetical protein
VTQPYDIVVRQVNREAVEPIGNRRAGRAPRLVVGAEHEGVNEELRASSEAISEGRSSFIGLEAILLLDANPGQLLPPLRQLVAASRQFLFGLEQLEPSRKPLFTCSGLMVIHRLLVCLFLVSCVAVGPPIHLPMIGLVSLMPVAITSRECLQ